MFINKIGTQHIEVGMNCQDFGFEGEAIKVVCDGCSEGLHTEVGAKTYCHLTSLGFENDNAFQDLVSLFGQSNTSIKNFLCFTILKLQENEEFYQVSNCGDGFVILQDIDGNITFEELTDGEYPKYYAYNYCDKDSLKHYKDGVGFEVREYNKTEYKNVGIASDGLRFIVNTDDDLRNEFISLLRIGNAAKVKRFINRNQKIFKDDITIIF